MVIGLGIELSVLLLETAPVMGEERTVDGEVLFEPNEAACAAN